MNGFIKKSGVYFDTKVKKGSNNAVTSDAVAKAIEEGGGGGGGTTDYTELSNKPKINDVELTGNKTLESLGIASAGSVGDLSTLTTTDKSSLVNAVNEIAGGGGSGGGLKYKQFASKTTDSKLILGGIDFVCFKETNVKTWFDTPPSRIHAIIAMKSTGVVKTAIRYAGNYPMEQTSTSVTYDNVGVFYE